ncbi:MAG: acetylxylan esterase [Bacteroides sp.]|nr:acetylxylan esterase [Bacteroides sp.]
MKRIVLTLQALMLLAFSCQTQKVGPWDLELLYQVPEWQKTDTAAQPGMTGILYESIPINGNTVEVFAYYSAPEGPVPEGGWPAVVCVHGGGGTAFNEWVQKWNEHGYAAISMDLEGHFPIRKASEGRGPRFATEYPGPSRVGVFGDYAEPIEEQWYYHAVAQVILAHSLIRSFPEVNPELTGITGISWGGTLTSTTMGVDNRFKFAIPVYGCGFLPGSDGHQGDVIEPGPQSDTVNKYWDGSAYFSNVKIPTLWVNGTNDKHFTMPITQASSRAVKGPATMRFQLRMRHGHNPGWAPEEIYAFANSIVKEGNQLIQFERPMIKEELVSVSFTYPGMVKEAKLLYTLENGVWPKRKWEETSANISGSSISASIPEGATVLFFTARDESDMMVSSEFILVQ